MSAIAPLAPILREPSVEVWCGDALAGLPGEVDCLITDPPYSERTHGAEYRGVYDDSTRHWVCDAYPHWTPADVRRAVEAWTPLVRGWFVALTDDELAPTWKAALRDAGRYVFACVPFLSPGSRVRLAGDGPSSWTCWIIVAQPKHAPYSKWGTLPGGYVFAPERMDLVGGKPLALMKALVSDYSRPGDLVCDPCCGAGTTLRAALDCGRRAVGVDINPAHCELARRRLAQGVLPLEVPA